MTYEDVGKGGRAGQASDAPGEELGMGSFGIRDIAAPVSEAPSFKPEQLEPYRVGGYELIPLHTPNAQDKNGRPIGKAPAESGWPHKPALSVDDAQAHMDDGGNVGVRLRTCDLVIDVDPRNFTEGDKPLDRLAADLGVDFTDYPTVVTGSGGLHIYMRKSDHDLVTETLDAYPGIEFKTHKRQVVAPGSVHPNGGTYMWDDDILAVPLSGVTAAPDALIDMARKPSAPASTDPGDVEPEQLAAMLDALSPADYREHDKWLSLAMACHHATGGGGRNEFIAWSTTDPSYADQGDTIGKRWDGFRSDKPGITQATLFKAVIDAGRQDLIPRPTAQDDFADDASDFEAPAVANAPVRSGAVDEWVYVVEPEQFVRRTDSRKWKREQWKSLYGHLKRDGDVLAAIWKGQIPMRKYEALVYLPGEAEFPDGEAGSRYNIWRQSGVEAKAGDVRPFLDHMAYLFADDAERDHVLDYLALLVQKPGSKINFALLVKGSQGTGKSWIGRVMTKIIGRRNVVFPTNDEVLSKWTVWTEGAQLGVVEELMANGRMDMANRLKPIVTEPLLRIEAKNANLYSIPNKLNLIAFTNHDNAVPIEEGDRRWLVVFSDALPKDEGYYDGLFRFLEADGPAAVKDWLLKRDIKLSPKGRAPQTKGKDEMRRLSVGEAEQYLADRLEEGRTPFDFDLVRLDDVVDAVPDAVARRVRNLRNRVSTWLKAEAGAVVHTRYTKADDSDRTSATLWSIRDHDKWRDVGAAGRADAFGRHVFGG